MEPLLLDHGRRVAQVVRFSKALIATGAWSNPNQPGTGAFGLSNNFLCSGCQGNSGLGRDQWDGKVTWNPTSKLSMFTRIGVARGAWYNPQIFGLLGGSQVSPSNGASVLISTAAGLHCSPPIDEPKSSAAPAMMGGTSAASISGTNSGPTTDAVPV